MEKKIRELTQVLKKPRKAFKSASEEEKQGLEDLRDDNLVTQESRTDEEKEMKYSKETRRLHRKPLSVL